MFHSHVGPTACTQPGLSPTLSAHRKTPFQWSHPDAALSFARIQHPRRPCTGASGLWYGIWVLGWYAPSVKLAVSRGVDRRRSRSGNTSVLRLSSCALLLQPLRSPSHETFPDRGQAYIVDVPRVTKVPSKLRAAFCCRAPLSALSTAPGLPTTSSITPDKSTLVISITDPHLETTSILNPHHRLSLRRIATPKKRGCERCLSANAP